MNALLVIDVQNDFLPGGPLGVPGGDQVVQPINALLPRFDYTIATQDWHPSDHLSFASQHPGRAPGDVIDLHGLQQILWPDHCVQNTPGADLAPGLDRAGIREIVRKGQQRDIDSYSAFYDNGRRRSTGLADRLRELGVRDVWIAGLALDYCVKFSALDAASEGFNVFLIEDACRGIGLKPQDIPAALEAMRAAGVRVVTVADAPRPVGR